MLFVGVVVDGFKKPRFFVFVLSCFFVLFCVFWGFCELLGEEVLRRREGEACENGGQLVCLGDTTGRKKRQPTAKDRPCLFRTRGSGGRSTTRGLLMGQNEIHIAAEEVEAGLFNVDRRCEEERRRKSMEKLGK